MELSLFDAAAKGFLNLLHLKVFLAMMIGVSIGTFTAVAPQGLGMPLVYAIALPIVIKWEPITGIALLDWRQLGERYLRGLSSDPLWHPRRLRLPGHRARRLPDGQARRRAARFRGFFHGWRDGMSDRHLYSWPWRFPPLGL